MFLPDGQPDQLCKRPPVAQPECCCVTAYTDKLPEGWLIYHPLCVCMSRQNGVDSACGSKELAKTLADTVSIIKWSLCYKSNRIQIREHAALSATPMLKSMLHEGCDRQALCLLDKDQNIAHTAARQGVRIAGVPVTNPVMPITYLLAGCITWQHFCICLENCTWRLGQLAPARQPDCLLVCEGLACDTYRFVRC
jgi:hypothetical protein